MLHDSGNMVERGRKSVRAGQRFKCCAVKGNSQDSGAMTTSSAVIKAVKIDGERFSPIALITNWIESSGDAALVSHHPG